MGVVDVVCVEVGVGCSAVAVRVLVVESGGCWMWCCWLICECGGVVPFWVLRWMALLRLLLDGWCVVRWWVLVVACVVDRAKRKPGKSTRARARLTKSGSRQEFVSRALAHKKWLGVNVMSVVCTGIAGLVLVWLYSR